MQRNIGATCKNLHQATHACNVIYIAECTLINVVHELIHWTVF